MTQMRLCWRAVAVLATLSLAACEGPAGPPGPPGSPGPGGDAGPPGDAGGSPHPGYAAREGLELAVDRVQVATDGTVHVFYTISDARGIPLDRAGLFSAG